MQGCCWMVPHKVRLHRPPCANIIIPCADPRQDGGDYPLGDVFARTQDKKGGMGGDYPLGDVFALKHCLMVVMAPVTPYRKDTKQMARLKPVMRTSAPDLPSLSLTW